MQKFLVLLCRSKKRRLFILLLALALLVLVLKKERINGSKLILKNERINGSKLILKNERINGSKLILKNERINGSNLTELPYSDLWRQINVTSKNLTKQLSMFKRGMSEEDYQLGLDLLSVFSRTMDRHNLTYFLYGGTLIGAIRHHGPIPWDDDIDIMVSWREKEKIIQAFESLKPDYTLYWTKEPHQWKLYSKQSRTPRSLDVPWNYPNLDIWLYKEEGERLLDWSYGGHDTYITTKYVFPLQKRRFADIELNCPCNPHAIMGSKDNLTECVSRYWSHKDEVFVDYPHTVPCQVLEDYFPFVHRIHRNMTTVEVLVYKGKVIGKQTLETLC